MYFDKFTTQEEVRARYRRLAKALHPDVGGDHEIMREINREYELKLADLDEAKSNPFRGNQQAGPFKEKPQHQRKPSDNIDAIVKVKAILAWAQERPSFDAGVVEGISQRLIEGRDLSEGHKKTLNNIIKGFKIDIQEWS